VVVHFGHLGNTLILINEGEAKPKGRNIGVIQWGINVEDTM